MNKYLIQVTIGPVQEFISSARKLRDLWFGSDLLSELSKTVARSLRNQGADLIFPFVSSDKDLEPDSSLIVSNKILAEISTDVLPADVILNAKIAWQEHRYNVAITTLEYISNNNKGLSINLNEELYKKQISDSGEFFAAWVTLTDNYKSSKAKLERLLAGRKNLREFNAPDWDGTGIPKNSLDGIRETVINKKQKEIRGLLKKNEKLDTLGCIKRFYPIAAKLNKKFNDLSTIALIPWLEGLKKLPNHKSLILSYISCFYKEDEIKKDLSNITPEKNSDCFYCEKKELKKLGALITYDALKRIIGEPQKYACILVGDGDNMGKALDQIQDAQGHRIFTRYLGEFANNVEETIKNYKGSLIYAGGDDVMAYIPIHQVIDCADAVQKQFAESMKVIFDKLQLSGDKPTFSAGVAIVHHSAPLDQALNIARKAESFAKDSGRDALAIIQNKRGGSELKICDKWEIPNKEGIINRFTLMCELYLSEQLPATLGYQLRQTSIAAGDILKFKTSSNNQKTDNNIIPLNAASASVIRIFNQKEYNHKLKTLLLHQTSIRKLSDELIIARQIANAQKMSQGGINREI